jgi:hypothetical protein
VLVNPELFPEPLTESLDMAKFFISRYPSLSAPEQYLQEATDLLDELHDLDYFTLSFAHAPMIAETTMKSCEQRLAKATSQRYIDVLEPKLAVCVTPSTCNLRVNSTKVQIPQGSVGNKRGTCRLRQKVDGIPR